MKDLLNKTRKINRLLQRAGGQTVDFDKISKILGETIGGNVYLVDKEGKFFDKTQNENYPLLKNRDKLGKKLKLLKKYKKLDQNKYNLLESVVILNKYDIDTS